MESNSNESDRQRGIRHNKLLLAPLWHRTHQTKYSVQVLRLESWGLLPHPSLLVSRAGQGRAFAHSEDWILMSSGLSREIHGTTEGKSYAGSLPEQPDPLSLGERTDARTVAEPSST